MPFDGPPGGFADRMDTMKYCLFCREAFDDDPQECPYCGGELVDELPGADSADQDAYSAGDDEPEPATPDTELLQVAIATSEMDLRAIVAVLKESDIYFEIEEVDRQQVEAGLVPGRAWRLLVGADEAYAAFTKLVADVPQAFPHSVTNALTPASEESESPSDVPAKIEEMLALPSSQSNSAKLAQALIRTFSSDNPDEMAAVKSILARHAATVEPLLAQIAVESAAAGGDGAERVLFHLMQVLEAVGYSEALGEIEALYDSPVPQVRTRAAYAAGRLGAVEAVERLLGLLEDEEEDVRYEASESIWRLTGLDFEFEPSAPVEEESENLARLREAWQRSGKSGHVRGKVTLADLFGRRP